MTRDPRPTGDRPPGPSDDADEVTRVGPRRPVRPELSTDALTHLDAALGFGSLDEPATQLRAAVDDPDPDVSGGARGAGAPTDAHPALMRPVSRAGVRPGVGGSRPTTDEPRALPDAELGRPRSTDAAARRRPGSAPRAPSRPGVPRPSDPAPRPATPPPAAVGGRSRRDPTDPELRPASLTADETGAARTVVIRRSTDPAVASTLASHPWLDDAPLDAFAPTANRESTDPSGRPAFMDREPTDPGAPPDGLGAREREGGDVKAMRGPASRRNKRVQTAPLGAARVSVAGEPDASEALTSGRHATGLDGGSSRAATRVLEAQADAPRVAPDGAPGPRVSALGERGRRDPVSASTPETAAASPGSGLHLGAAARPAPALPSRHRTTAPGLGSPGRPEPVSPGVSRQRRPEVTTEVEPRPPPRGHGEGDDRARAAAPLLPREVRPRASATERNVDAPRSPSIVVGAPQPLKALRALSLLVMVLLFAAVALPTSSGPPWQHVADPGSVTFVALAFLLLAGVAHLLPARPAVQAGVTLAVGLLALVFAVVLGRGAVAADLFDGQPAMVALLGAPLGALIVVLACALLLLLGLLWRGVAPHALGPRITVGAGAALALLAYLGMGALGVGEGPAVAGAVEAMRSSPFLGDRLVAALGLAPLLVAVVGVLTLHPQVAPRAATGTAVGLWLAMAVPMLLAALFVATSDAWLVALEPIKLVMFLAVPLLYVPIAATMLLLAASR